MISRQPPALEHDEMMKKRIKHYWTFTGLWKN